MQSVFFRALSRWLLLLFLAVASVAIAAPAQADDARRAENAIVKNPHYGPYTQEIASVGAWNVKPGYLSLDPDDTTRLMEKMENPGIKNTWLYAPDGSKKWFALVHYDSTGHVKDDETIDADAIFYDLKKDSDIGNEERRKHGWAEVRLMGWQVKPHYEADTKRLSWAIRAESGDKKIINYTTKILSRTGVATVTLVTEPDQLDASIADLKTQLNGFSFSPDQMYGAFRSGDKIAEYGLTGLIVGGTAAAAVKTGGWKWLLGILAAGWKFIAAGMVALLAGVKRIFKRRAP